MRLPHPTRGVSWPHTELHRRPHWRCPHASPPPGAALRGPIGKSIQGPSGGVHMRLPHSTALLGPIRNSTEGPSGGVHMRLPRPARRFVAP
eukprot:8616647-Pyramimonas_sp.AAC.2